MSAVSKKKYIPNMFDPIVSVQKILITAQNDCSMRIVSTHNFYSEIMASAKMVPDIIWTPFFGPKEIGP